MGLKTVGPTTSSGPKPGSSSPIHTPLPPLEFKTAEEKLVEAIRRRAPEFGFVTMRLEFKDGRLFDAVFLKGEERIRLE